MKSQRIFLAGVLGLLGIIGADAACAAEDYPAKPVEIVVSLPPGGGVDLAARTIAIELSKNLKQSFVVENRPGASGIIAAAYVAGAKPDGYTLLATAANLVTAPYLLKGNTLDVEHDLTPIALFATIPYVVVINPSLPIKDPNDLVQWIKGHPGEFRWAHGGIGSPDHLAIEMFDKLAGIDPLKIPYSGSGPAMVGTLGGEATGMMSSPGPARTNIASGALRAIAITSRDPSDLLSGIPPVAKFGFDDFDVEGWYAILGPKDLPPEIAEKIQKGVLQAVQAPEVRKKLNASGITLTGSMSPAEFKTYLKSELDKYGAIIKDLGLQGSQK